MAPPFCGLVAPAVQWNWSDDALPAICSAVESAGLVLSYQPRLDMLVFSKFSEKSSVPLPGGGGGGGGVTVTIDVPDLPEQVAVIVADPADAPETRPLELTAATELLLLVHVYG